MPRDVAVSILMNFNFQDGRSRHRRDLIAVGSNAMLYDCPLCSLRKKEKKKERKKRKILLIAISHEGISILLNEDESMHKLVFSRL